MPGEASSSGPRNLSDTFWKLNKLAVTLIAVSRPTRGRFWGSWRQDQIKGVSVKNLLSLCHTHSPVNNSLTLAVLNIKIKNKVKILVPPCLSAKSIVAADWSRQCL